MEHFNREELQSLRMLLLLTTAPDRMAGMGLDPAGKEFRVAMKFLDILREDIAASPKVSENARPPVPNQAGHRVMALSYIVPGESE